MSDTSLKNETSSDKEEIYKTVDTVNVQLSTLETFIARRFDEISMEINASAQQADMAEDGISNRFSEILEVLGAINYSGTGDSAANSGVELESVIKETEVAANEIMDSADVIMDCINNDADWEDKEKRNSHRTTIGDEVQKILMACSFQDRTGQRIRNTLDDLHGIEDRLNSTFETLGIEVKKDDEAIKERVKDASSQDDIDALFD
ncbi:MAG: hypothetical protein ACRBB3_04795 [Alphaproteobacteria bacterium]